MSSQITVDQVGAQGGEAWLICSERSAVLVDAGFPYYGEALAENLKSRLNGIPLTNILITHSHYDHAGGFARVKAAFPDAVVSAAAHAQEILRREGALGSMRALNRIAASLTGGAFEAMDVDVGGYCVDRILGEGDRIHNGEFCIEALDTPGHTNDSLSYRFPDQSLIALSESTGIFLKAEDIYVEPAFIVSWKAALAATERIEKIAPHMVIVPHAGVLAGDDVSSFLRKEKEEIILAKDLIFRLSAEGKTEDDILSVFKTRYYDRRPGALTNCQPLSAFLINHKAMIPRILAEGE